MNRYLRECLFGFAVTLVLYLIFTGPEPAGSYFENIILALIAGIAVGFLVVGYAYLRDRDFGEDCAMIFGCVLGYICYSFVKAPLLAVLNGLGYSLLVYRYFYGRWRKNGSPQLKSSWDL